MAIRRVIKRRFGLLLLGAALLVAFWPQGVVSAEMTAIRAYQIVGSPVTAMVSRCRYEPSCSHYALSALEGQGLWLGNWLMLKRLSMCSPLGFLIDQLS